AIHTGVKKRPKLGPKLAMITRPEPSGLAEEIAAKEARTTDKMGSFMVDDDGQQVIWMGQDAKL
ncbi:MAG: hypothetical protein SGARI_001004, partial [Bacillariaceae sp.]